MIESSKLIKVQVSQAQLPLSGSYTFVSSDVPVLAGLPLVLSSNRKVLLGSSLLCLFLLDEAVVGVLRFLVCDGDFLALVVLLGVVLLGVVLLGMFLILAGVVLGVVVLAGWFSECPLETNLVSLASDLVGSAKSFISSESSPENMKNSSVSSSPFCLVPFLVGFSLVVSFLSPS